MISPRMPSFPSTQGNPRLILTHGLANCNQKL